VTGAVNVALAGAVLALWGFAYGAYFRSDLRRWWRSRREPADARMLRAHAEWVRRTKVVRPPLPRRPTATRPATMRMLPPPQRVIPAAAATPPPSNVIPFPKPPDSRPR